ncbi:MAG: DegV family protein [Anaerolineae bacterium]|nr:DegV family protein [Anaerolineae bacterium]
MVKIVTDTTSGLSPAVAEQHGISLLPQIIVFGAQSYRDDTELDTQAFLSKLRAASELPTTAAPPPALFVPVFEKLLAEGHSIVCLHPSTELSGTVRGAAVAAQDFPGADIRVVDTRTIAAPMAMIVLQANRWAQEGLDADTIVARVEDLMPRQRVYFVVDTLEYLHKGGRIGGAKALLGGLLQIKPILHIQNGRVEPLEQQRTGKRAKARLRELVMQDCPHGPESYLCVMHVEAEAEAQALAADLGAALDVPEVPIFLLPPAIVVHGGPGILGAGFFVRP